jgi:hypothetical protein
MRLIIDRSVNSKLGRKMEGTYLAQLETLSSEAEDKCYVLPQHSSSWYHCQAVYYELSKNVEKAT